MEIDDNSCSSMKHPEHMCSLFKNGCTAEIARLEKDPNYVCEKCGRKSHLDKNLCSPTPCTPSIIGT